MFSNKYGNKRTTCNLKVMSRCLSAPYATSLHHCLKNKQLNMASVVRIQVISISTVEDCVANTNMTDCPP